MRQRGRHHVRGNEGAPQTVYVCACRNCRKKSGSAFTYAAIFAAEEVSVAGAATRYITGDSGRWIENNFCPTCGGAVFFTLEGLPGAIGSPVGAIDMPDLDADSDAPDFAAPRVMHWSPRRPHWLPVPQGIEALETQ